MEISIDESRRGRHDLDGILAVGAGEPDLRASGVDPPASMGTGRG